MRLSVFILLRLIWIALAVMVLFITLFFYDGKTNSDVDTILAYGMFILSFPIGLLMAIFAGGIGYVANSLYGYVVPVSYLTIAIGWILFFVVGYLQWFVLVPFIWSKVRKNKKAKGGLSVEQR